MTGKVVIHIGLHKTGTRYLQRMVFAQLDPGRFRFDPPELSRPLRVCLRGRRDATARAELAQAVAAWRAGGDERTLVFSQPHASGDMYSSHDDFEENAALVHEMFPEARIIYVVRNQAGWLQSAYRQQLVRGKGMPVETFLNFYDGEFRPRPHRWLAGARTVEALTLRFLDIYRVYAQAFGAENVYLLRQEDMRRRKREVDARIADALGVERLPEPPHRRSQNRSFSALAIHLFYPGSLRRPARPDPHRAGEGPGWLHQRLRFLRRLRTHLIRHGFDRLLYVDWDLLQRNDLRRRIDAHYAEESRGLAAIADTVLEHGPRGVGEDAGTRPRKAASESP